MSKTEISIETPDGAARAYKFTPEGQGPWPAVIFYMDALAIRPALFEMCERLASHGYFVLLPDMFWRLGPYPPMIAEKVFNDDALKQELFGKYMPSTNPERVVRDTGAFLAYLARDPQVSGSAVGVTGYCMGGGMALRAAGEYPDRVVAVWPPTNRTARICWHRKSRPRCWSEARTRTAVFRLNRPSV